MAIFHRTSENVQILPEGNMKAQFRIDFLCLRRQVSKSAGLGQVTTSGCEGVRGGMGHGGGKLLPF